MIKIEKNNLLTLAFADFDKTKLGERVFLIGNDTVEEGIISSFDEDYLSTNILGSVF